MIYRGECEAVLPAMFDPGHFDACVTDPPYGFRFMGKAWDYDVPGAATWLEVLRVLKPGAFLLAFGGARTYHRVVTAIEDAGFEIRDQIMWLYGSGFPKSKNLGDGRGTALKPAHEPIVVARKPFIGTVEQNAVAHGTGVLNIDDCRVPTTENLNGGGYTPRTVGNAWEQTGGMNKAGACASRPFVQPEGRWPANVVHDGSGEVLAAFPDAPGQIADASSSSSSRKTQNVYGAMKRGNEASAVRVYSDQGGTNFALKPGARRFDAGSAARFYYCAKASKADREDGCDALPLREGDMRSETSGQHITRRDGNAPSPVRNCHPTVKPTELMRYLCRLVTPAGGTVLDPFAGSGSTGRGAALEGFKFVGIEREADYAEIARARVSAAIFT